MGHTRKFPLRNGTSVICPWQNDFHPAHIIWAYGEVAQVCAHQVSSSFSCLDYFFNTKCFRKLVNRIQNIFLFVGDTQSRGSTRNVQYSCRGGFSLYGNLKNTSMAFYPCFSINVISKIYTIWKWWRPGSLASVSSQLSFTWSCEINYMQQIPTADKFFSICFSIRE